jgi:hypothetical protein
MHFRQKLKDFAEQVLRQLIEFTRFRYGLVIQSRQMLALGKWFH